MDWQRAYYESNRCDRFLTYVGANDPFTLVAFCVRINPDVKPVSIFNGDVFVEADYKLDGKDVVVYLDGKIHSNLYSDGFTVSDGYGRAIHQFRLDESCLRHGEQSFRVHTAIMGDIQSYEQNIKEWNPANLYGPIPTAEVTLEEAGTDYTILGAVSGLNKKTIVALYSNPGTIKKQIENDVILSTLCL